MSVQAIQFVAVILTERFKQFAADFVSPGDDDAGDALFNLLNTDGGGRSPVVVRTMI